MKIPVMMISCTSVRGKSGKGVTLGNFMWGIPLFFSLPLFVVPYLKGRFLINSSVDCSLSGDPYKYNMLPPLPAQRNLTPPPTLYPQQPVSVTENYNLPRFSFTGSQEISSTTRSKRADINVWCNMVSNVSYTVTIAGEGKCCVGCMILCSILFFFTPFSFCL